jgi:hypothetical protein
MWQVLNLHLAAGSWDIEQGSCCDSPQGPTTLSLSAIKFQMNPLMEGGE